MSIRSIAAPAPSSTRTLAFTRYSFTSRLLCTNQASFHSPRPPALPTLLQYYCTILGQYTTPLPTSRLYAIHHTIFVITISCKGQARSQIPEGKVREGLCSHRRLWAETSSCHTSLPYSRDLCQSDRSLPWRLQDIVLLRGLGAQINHLVIVPPPALPTRLQYYCNTIAQYSTPLRPPISCHTPYYVVHSNIV